MWWAQVTAGLPAVPLASVSKPVADMTPRQGAVYRKHCAQLRDPDAVAAWLAVRKGVLRSPALHLRLGCRLCPLSITGECEAGFQRGRNRHSPTRRASAWVSKRPATRHSGQIFFLPVWYGFSLCYSDCGWCKFFVFAGSHFPNQGSNLGPQQWKCQALTTGPPGNCWCWDFFRGFFFPVFQPCHVACGILVPNQGSNPCPLHWESGILAIRPSGKSLFAHFWIRLFFHC